MADDSAYLFKASRGKFVLLWLNMRLDSSISIYHYKYSAK